MSLSHLAPRYSPIKSHTIQLLGSGVSTWPPVRLCVQTGIGKNFYIWDIIIHLDHQHLRRDPFQRVCTYCLGRLHDAQCLCACLDQSPSRSSQGDPLSISIRLHKNAHLILHVDAKSRCIRNFSSMHESMKSVINNRFYYINTKTFYVSVLISYSWIKSKSSKK